MKLPELKLRMAIHLYRENGGHSREISNPAEMLERAMQVAKIYFDHHKTTLFSWDFHEVDEHILSYRKATSGKVVKRAELLVECAFLYGTDCFWKYRGKGPCSDEIDLGHIVADSKGGELSVENSIIECSGHNRQHQGLSFDEYLLRNDLDRN